MPSNPIDTKASLRVMLIIWAAMLMACFAYGAVFAFILPDWRSADSIQTEAVTVNPVGYGFIILALLSMIGGIFLPPLATRKFKGSPFLKLQTTLLIRCACFEGVGIYGLAGGILSAFPTAFSIGMISIGACLIAMTLPWLLSSHERITRELAKQS